MSDSHHRPLLDGLRGLARSARALVGRTAATAAEAGRATARRLTPDPVAPGGPACQPASEPLVARFSSLGARLANLEAAVAGGPAELHGQVRASARLIAETERLLAEAGAGVGESPTLADPAHLAAAAARRAMHELERSAAPSQEVRRALAALTHPRREIRLEALAHLGEPPDPRLLPVLAIVSRTPDADAGERRAIMALVRQLGDAASDSPLVAAALEDEDTTVRLYGVQTVARSNAAAAALEPLAAADPSPAVRRLSVGVLVQRAAPRCSARVEQALRDPDPSVRLETVKTVAGRGDAAVVLPLMRALLDRDAAVQAAAAQALGRWGLDVAGLPAFASLAARRAAVTRLRREWARTRFAAAATVPGEAELDDPLGAEFLLSARDPGERADGHGR